jgi:hypothetical protein
MLAWLFPSPHLKNDISDIEKATATDPIIIMKGPGGELAQP